MRSVASNQSVFPFGTIPSRAGLLVYVMSDSITIISISSMMIASIPLAQNLSSSSSFFLVVNGIQNMPLDEDSNAVANTTANTSLLN